MSMQGFAPGLYSLLRGTPDTQGGCGIDDPDAAPAWVLVVNGSGFSVIESQWKSYLPGLKRLAQDTSPEVATTVRHAILSALADAPGN